jgi:hypothetical protein
LFLLTIAKKGGSAAAAFLNRPELDGPMLQPLIDDDHAPAPRFLTLDRRIPEQIRVLVDEADGCANMAFAVGGSSCMRLAIRQTFERESIAAEDFHTAIVALRGKHPSVAPTLFQVIERLGGGDAPLQGDALKALIATFKAVLYEMYVLGEERRETLAYLSEVLQALDVDKIQPNPRPARAAREPGERK